MRIFKNLFFLTLTGLCCFFLFSGSLQAAEGLIEGVEFHEKDGNRESVAFHLNGPYLPRVFALKGDKPRVVFDFTGTRLGRTVPTSIDAGGNMVHKIRLGRHEDRTRAVIDLVPGGDFNFEQSFDEAENILTIQLFSSVVSEKQGNKPAAAVEQQEDVLKPAPESEVAAEVVSEEEVPAETVVAADEAAEEDVAEITPAVTETPEQEAMATAVAPLPSSPVAESTPSPDPLLSDVTFEKTSDKGEMVLFKLNGFYPPEVSGEEEGVPQVICDFAGARLAESVVKEQASNGEYVSRVKVEKLDEPEIIRVTLYLVANKNYDLQQVFFKEENLFVIIVNSYDALAVPADSKE